METSLEKPVMSHLREASQLHSEILEYFHFLFLFHFIDKRSDISRYSIIIYVQTGEVMQRHAAYAFSRIKKHLNSLQQHLKRTSKWCDFGSFE